MTDKKKKIYAVFEGPDNVGKTTVVDEIAKRLSLTKYHGPVPPKSGVDKWYTDRLAHVLGLSMQDPNSNGVIFDRFHFSDRAYAGVFGSGRLTDQCYQMLDDMLYKMGAKTVLMYDEPSLVYKRLVEEGKDNLTEDQVRQIILRYSKAYDETEIAYRRKAKLTDLGGIMTVGRVTKFQPEQGLEDLIDWLKR